MGGGGQKIIAEDICPPLGAATDIIKFHVLA
jgi:hypothetical protein